jgi:hypothetical protein
VWSVLVVVLSSGVGDRGCFLEAREEVFVEALVSEAAVEALDVGVLDGLAWAVNCQATWVLQTQPAVVMLANSGPLSLTMVVGFSRSAMSLSSTVITRLRARLRSLRPSRRYRR